MSEPGPNDLEFPARGKKPPNPFFWVGYDAFDLYVPIMGPDCFTVYAYFARRYHADPTLKHDIRSLARSCNLSTSTALRACEVLDHLHLLKLLRFNGNRQSECKLFDSWTVAKSLGAEFDSKSKTYRFPAQVSERLRSEVREIRKRQQGQGKTAREARIPCGNLPLRVSRRNTGVSLETRQRTTRETQTGTHLIQKEERIERTQTPTPTRNECGDTDTTPNDKDFPDEDEPDGLLRWAQMRFTGVIDDMRVHLLDTNRPPVPRIRNGVQDWEESGFNHMAVEAAELRGARLVLTISVPDPAVARRGVAKYQRTWDRSILKWYEGETEVVFVPSRRRPLE